MVRAQDEIQVPARWIWLFTGAGAAAISLAVTGQVYLTMLDHGHAFWRLFVWQLSCWGFWVAFAPFLFRVGSTLLVQGSPGATSPWRWFKIVGIGLGLTVVHIPFAAIFVVYLQPYVPVSVYDMGEAIELQLETQFAGDLLAYAMLVGSGYALAVYHRARKLELRQSRLEHELTRAHLEALRLEIQPHFLFNTLNSMAALIRKGANAEALSTLVELGGLLRTSLERGDEPLTTVGAEIDFVRRYVDLQRTRFSDRLEVAYDVREECLDYSVPTLSLQPLVENALRHGAAPRSGRCHIEIGAQQQGDNVRLWVSDDGVGVASDFDLHGHQGIGLRNTTSRLAELYGEKARLNVRRGKAGGTVSEIVIPAARKPERLQPVAG